MSEHTEQTVIFDWAHLKAIQYHELSLLFAIPNGAKLPWRMNSKGQRYSPEASRLKSEGLRAGAPDMFLACGRQGYLGLFIELKFGKNKPTPEQTAFMNRLEGEGYHVEVCYGANQAIQVIKDYLNIKD